MIWPCTRLLWVVALGALPLCALGGALSFLLLPCAVALCAFFVIAAMDAAALIRQAQTWQVTSDSKPQWFKGRTGIIHLDLTGESKRETELLVYLELPPELYAAEPVLKVHFRGTGEVEAACLPGRRGHYEITNCFLSSRSPLKFWRNRTKRPVHIDVRVYPDLQRDSAARMLMLRRSGGMRRLRLVGRGRDFERLRDYAPGDSFDEVYWKATARRGSPIVKVFQVERTQDVYVIIDSSRLSARHDALEQFVSAALTVALATENEGDNFGLVTFSNRVDQFVRAGKGKAHFSRCRDAIYDLSASTVSPDFEDLFTYLQLQVRRRSLLLFLTDLSDPMLSEAFLRDAPLLARKHVLIVSQVADEENCPLFSGAAPSNLEEVSERLAGHLQWVKLQDLQHNLGQKGVKMHYLKSGSASADLVRRYLEVKQKQAI
jgi:uncharacterized protein (DUF58 family)